MSMSIEKLKEHFNSRPVPEGVKCLAEERDKVNALIDAVEDENKQLRRLVMEWYPHMEKRVGIDALWQWGYIDIIRELGIEVG